MAKFTNPQGIDINLTPWFDMGFGLSMIHLTEQLGGTLASGEIVLMHNGSKSVIEAYENETYGILTLEKEEMASYEIPIFIYSKSIDWRRNYIHLYFYCGINDKKFVSSKEISEWTSLDSAITGLFPGKVDIRCKSDVTLANDDKLYQCNETGIEFLTPLCYGYKRESIFAFGWEGLMIKEMIDEPGGDKTGALISDTSTVQADLSEREYQPKLFNFPYNPWEPDYTEQESINLKTLLDYNTWHYIRTGYDTMMMNLKYNKMYQDSTMFQNFKVINTEMPGYKLGQVVYYKRANSLPTDAIGDPSSYFLIKSNDLFISGPDSEFSDEEGNNFSWASQLVGLELTGSGIAVGTEEDNYGSRT